jgi:hypothetical protein
MLLPLLLLLLPTFGFGFAGGLVGGGCMVVEAEVVGMSTEMLMRWSLSCWWWC